MSKKPHVEAVYVWRLDGKPRVTSSGDPDDHFRVLLVTLQPRITVKSFERLLGAAFANQGWESFVGSNTFNALVEKILEPTVGYNKRAVPIWRSGIRTDFHLWHWQLLGNATLRMGA